MWKFLFKLFKREPVILLGRWGKSDTMKYYEGRNYPY